MGDKPSFPYHNMFGARRNGNCLKNLRIKKNTILPGVRKKHDENRLR